MPEKVTLAIFDLDGTLLKGNVWNVFIKYFRNKRRLRLTLFLSYHLLPLPLFKMGLFSKERYFTMWAENLSWLLKGLTVEEANKMFDEMTERFFIPNLRKKLLQKIEKHKKEGMISVLDSGTFTPILQRIALNVGIEHVFGTDLEVKKGKLTGKITGRFNSGEEKIERLERFFTPRQKEIDWQNSYAYADSIFDIPLLKKVGNPVVVIPDEDLLSLAIEKGWDILTKSSFEETPINN